MSASTIEQERARIDRGVGFRNLLRDQYRASQMANRVAQFLLTRDMEDLWSFVRSHPEALRELPA